MFNLVNDSYCRGLIVTVNSIDSGSSGNFWGYIEQYLGLLFVAQMVLQPDI
jgi:hypothetical protein